MSRAREDGLLSSLTTPLVVLFLAGVAAALIAPVFTRHAGPRPRRHCMNNLKMIAIALHVYAVDHKDTFPESLAPLQWDYIQDPDILECPEADPDNTPHYIYVAGLSPKAPPDLVLAHDRETNHGGRGRNVAFVDGHVEWMEEKPFRAALSRTVSWRAAHGAATRATE
jgi:prepilin-type processing-associated H-X9-DG protein